MARFNNSLILVLALLSGFGAFIFSINMSKKPPSETSNLMVVSAIKDIEFGNIIRQEDVDLMASPPNINSKVLFTEFKPVVGKIARQSISKGEPIKSIYLLGEGENLASLIPAGYRAMVIPVTLPQGLADLIQVGNRVDVLLTYEKGRGEYDSKTLVKSVKVIKVEEPSSKGAVGRGNSKEISITLAVSPEGAETLAYSMKKGTLNVIVRPLAEDTPVDEKFFTLRELFFGDKGANEEGPLPQGIEIIRGLNRETYQIAKHQSDENNEGGGL